MEIAKKIEKLEKELQELKEREETEKREAKKKFVVKGRLIVVEAERDTLHSLPEEFRRISISIVYTNKKEAREVGIQIGGGGMTYHYLEGWIVGLGGGMMILDVPCEATEIEWQSIIDGNVSRKFLRDWVKVY